MKKQLIYVGLFLAMAGLSACNEDYKDWADPQSNPQEDATSQLTAVFAVGKDANIDMGTATTDSVEIAQLVSSTAEEGSTNSFKSITLDDIYTVPFTQENGKMKVALSQLDSVTQLAYQSRASVERELKLTLKGVAVTPSGDGILLSGNDLTIKLKPAPTPVPDPVGYYIVGDFTGWNAAGALAMTKDPTKENFYTLEIETESKDQNFKIFPAAAVTDEIDWSKALGSNVDGDTSEENFVYWDNAQAIKIAGVGKTKITLDVTNFRFTVKDNSAPSELYMTGSGYGWGGAWMPFVPVHSTKGAFWGIFHFDIDEEVKFAPQAAWGGDFGFVTISEESIERAGLSDSGGNIKIGKAGWYLVYVSVVGNDKTVDFYAPHVYLIGGTAKGGWAEQLTESDLFTIPTTADGEFVSPAFSASDKVRICVHPKNELDWWKTEFIVLAGKIAYRGNGDDQEAVEGTMGQKVYLKFSDNTGEIK